MDQFDFEFEVDPEPECQGHEAVVIAADIVRDFQLSTQYEFGSGMNQLNHLNDGVKLDRKS